MIKDLVEKTLSATQLFKDIEDKISYYQEALDWVTKESASRLLIPGLSVEEKMKLMDQSRKESEEAICFYQKQKEDLKLAFGYKTLDPVLDSSFFQKRNR